VPPTDPFPHRVLVAERAFSDILSAAPDADFSLANRTDPYFSGLFESSASASWISLPLALRHRDSGLQALPSTLDIDQGEAIERVLHRNNLQRSLDVLAVLDSWRTATGEQIAAISGVSAAASTRSTLMPELFAAGLVDIGVISNALGRTAPLGRTTLFRPSRSPVFDREIAPRLTYPEWVSVTGGHAWESGSQFDRHNILATEVALRVSELSEIGGVLGEKLSTVDLLAHTGLGRSAPYGARRAADATLIRTDGARIAIEITASAGPHLRDKIRRWAELLESRPTDMSGLHVIFLLAPNLGKGLRRDEYVNDVRAHVLAGARDYAGSIRHWTSTRMFVASWTDWFPNPNTFDEKFLTLEAHRPSGRGETRWETASALDPIDTPFDPQPGWDALAVLDNLALLRSVPSWLRTGKAPELWPTAIKRLGFNRIPVTEPTKPLEYVGLPLGAASGATAQTLPPRRLRARP
jgi:hypothetical protein